MSPLSPTPDVFVIGAGIMGAGIALVAAQAGCAVKLFDMREGAADEAHRKLGTSLKGLVAKGRMSEAQASAAMGRIEPVAHLGAAVGSGLVVEAIVENLQAKRTVFRELEGIVEPGCVLASNTSSISITALANGLQHPGRFVGMHFFNPVPLMKLVEVISGLQTDPAVAARLADLATAWGKVPVHARSTPGFIVNRIARPYYAETLALLHERAGEPALIDACLRGAGFRMGPCELMDLIGHDTNFAVTESVFSANFGDRRYAPSLVQRELVDGGLLGRKSGRGFFDYREPPAKPEAPAHQTTAPPNASRIVLRGEGMAIDRWSAVLKAAGVPFGTAPASAWIGVEADGAQLRLTDGRPAAQVALAEGIVDVALFDLPIAVGGGEPGTALAWSASRACCPAWQERATQWLASAGWAPQRLGDAAGLVVARTIAMLINEAADAVLQGVCTPDAADAAMKLGVNYPAGPFEWLARWDAAQVVRLLDHLDTHYRGERYRASPELRQRAWAIPAAPAMPGH